MLDAYLTQTQRLLQNPGAPTSLYSQSDLTSYINTARSQIAIEGECVRVYATLAISAGQNTYNFSAINLSGSPAVGGVQTIRMITGPTALGGTLQQLNGWPFEWFNLYFLCAATPIAETAPTDWTQFAQGASGSVIVSPTPDTSYTLQLDTVCYPIPLVTDSTAEAIPYPWTDCVPFFAAFYALLSAQGQARQGDADRMFARYNEFKDRARKFSTPSIERSQYLQGGVPVRNIPIDSTAAAQGAQA